jgi:hypothetical protein
MATTVAQAFSQFRKNLEITTLQESTVSTRQQNVRSNIAKTLNVIGDFVTGSYQRSTLIAPLKDADVDVFVVLHHSAFSAPPNGPANVLAQLKRAIDKAYNEPTESSRNRHAITIKFSDFRVDVVPAFNSQRAGYLIPDPNESKWIETNPKTHVQLWSASNSQHNGMLVPFIKMIKAWNCSHSRRFHSFHLESMVRDVFMKLTITNFQSAAAYFFENAYNHISLLDPAGYGGNLSSYLSNSAGLYSQINSSFVSAAQQAREAISLDAADKTDKAINKWRIVFGDYFPGYG